MEEDDKATLNLSHSEHSIHILLEIIILQRYEFAVKFYDLNQTTDESNSSFHNNQT